MRYTILLLAFLISVNLSFSQNKGESENLLIINARYLDIHKMEFKDGTIIIEDGSIIEVEKQINPSSPSKVFDAKGKYLIPGLIDAHIHLFQSGGIYTRPDAVDLTKYKPYKEEREWLKENAGDLMRRYLRCGITTIVDIGGPMSNYSIRDQYENDSNYPNLFLTGPLVSTYQPPAFNIEDSPIIKVNTKEDAIKLVQKQLPYKPNFIKIWGIPLPDQTEDSMMEIMEATAKESHKNGLRLAVHATDLNSAKIAVHAGADFLVHSVSNPIDEEFIQMLVEKNVVYIPTLIVGPNYAKSFAQATQPTMEDFEISNPFALGTLFDGAHLTEVSGFQYYKTNYPTILAKNEENDLIAFDNLRKLISAGVTIATGTDAGNIGTLHGTSYYDEIAKMKNAGMTNSQILVSSTINGAKMLGKEDLLGSIEKGKIADLLILDHNPLEDINALKSISVVIKTGKVHLVDEILSDTPEILAQKQLNAYNAGNIEAFLEPYAEDVELYDFPNNLTSKGKDNMRKNYSVFFENTPNLHCELINRMVLGNTVVDQERLTGLPNESIIEALAVYKIENNKISKVYFVRK